MKFSIPGLNESDLSFKARKAMQDHLAHIDQEIAAAREDGIKQGLAADDSKAKELALLMASDNQRLRSKVIQLQHGSKAEPDEEMLTAWRNELYQLHRDGQATEAALDSILLAAYWYGFGYRKQETEELAALRDEVARLKDNVVTAEVEVNLDDEEDTDDS